MKLTFTKMHGSGNDFVVLDGLDRPVTLSAQQFRRLADRHTGIGCDQIIVLEEGRIIERGSHEELYGARGRYYDLYTKQHGLETNLFLAPGEGDKVEEPGSGEDEETSAVSETVRALHH